jgi:hypothetical protein
LSALRLAEHTQFNYCLNGAWCCSAWRLTPLSDCVESSASYTHLE